MGKGERPSAEVEAFMALPAPRRSTFADLWSVPDDCVGEIIAGELVVSPRPAPAHAFAQLGLGAELKGPFQKGRGGPGGWLILPEPELHLSQEALVPDLAGWKDGRLPPFKEAAIEIAPDWLCEILSPRTEARDRGAKARAYARAGVAHYWLLNPRTRTLEVWRLEGGRWVVLDLFEGDAHVQAEPFDAVPLDLGELWRGPPPSPQELDADGGA